MKTITSLINANKKVYVRMSSDEICKAFFAQAEKEEFLFGGIKPTAKHPSDLIAVLSDKTLCYVGTIGRNTVLMRASLSRFAQRGFFAPCFAVCRPVCDLLRKVG